MFLFEQAQKRSKGSSRFIYEKNPLEKNAWLQKQKKNQNAIDCV